MATKRYIKSNDVCHIVSDKFIEQGVKRNQLVYVAGHRVLPIAENDPYTQRIKFLCQLLSKDGELDQKLYLIDPTSLSLVGKKKQEHYLALIKERYGEDSSNRL